MNHDVCVRVGYLSGGTISDTLPGRRLWRKVRSCQMKTFLPHTSAFVAPDRKQSLAAQAELNSSRAKSHNPVAVTHYDVHHEHDVSSCLSDNTLHCHINCLKYKGRDYSDQSIYRQ